MRVRAVRLFRLGSPGPGRRARLLPALLLCLGLGSCTTQEFLLPEMQGVPLQVLWKEWREPLSLLPPDVRMRPALGQIGDAPVSFMAGGTRIWATDLRTGLFVWERGLDPGDAVSSGLTLHDGTLYLTTREGHLLALSSTDGSEKYRTYLSGEAIVPVAATDDRIVVRTSAGLVLALRPRDGSEVWSIQLEEPRLTLRGTAVPVLRQNSVLILTDSCRLLGLQLEDGTRLFNVALSAPKGVTELDRLIDGDGTPAEIAGTVYTSCYKGEMRALNLVQGNLSWSAEIPSLRDLLQYRDSVYVVDTEGVVVRVHRGNGRDLWRQGDLEGRNPTHPLLWNDWLALGDHQGYIHLLSRTDGKILGRTRPLCGPGKLPNSRVCGQIRELVPTPEGLLALSEMGWVALLAPL